MAREKQVEVTAKITVQVIENGEKRSVPPGDPFRVGQSEAKQKKAAGIYFDVAKADSAKTDAEEPKEPAPNGGGGTSDNDSSQNGSDANPTLVD